MGKAPEGIGGEMGKNSLTNGNVLAGGNPGLQLKTGRCGQGKLTLGTGKAGLDHGDGE